VYPNIVYNGTKQTLKFFNTTGREVKTGFTVSVIMSQWTWLPLCCSPRLLHGILMYLGRSGVQAARRLRSCCLAALQLSSRPCVQHTPSARSSLLSGEANTYDILVLLLPRKSQVHVKTFSTDLVYNGLQVVMGMDSHQCKATFSANGKTFSKAGEYSCGLW
jgi:hypothetical protein